MPRARSSLCLLLVSLCLFLGRAARAQDSLRNPHRAEILFNVELGSDRSLFSKSLERTPQDGLIAKMGNGRDTLISGRRVSRVTFLSTPLDAPHEIPWDSIPLQPCQDCFCDRLEGAGSFFEVHGGVTWRGNAQYPVETVAGTELIDAKGFASSSVDGTVGTFQGDAAYGWRWERVRFGAFAGAFSSDGSMFVPAGLHFAYDLGWMVSRLSESLGFCPNVFANAAIPFDFRTHAPIFFSTFKRTRKFFSGGLGFERRMSAHWNWSLDVGVEYLTVPLSYVPCNCDISNEDHYLVRSILSTILVFGVSF